MPSFSFRGLRGQFYETASSDIIDFTAIPTIEKAIGRH